MHTLKLGLDWTPNINHIGFFVAQELGFYKAMYLNVEIIDTAADDYATTPAKKVELGELDMALCPIESVISYQTKSSPFDLTAIAALLKEDLSAIIVAKDSGIDRPKDLDDKIYSSYQARYEDGIVKEMIKNDGGKGTLQITYPNKLGVWHTLLKKESDATWIFLNWEGVEIEAVAESFNCFKMKDYGIPYSYSPVIAASKTQLIQQSNAFQAFLKATKKGYLYTQEHPEKSIEILKRHLPERDKKINLNAALSITSPNFGNKFNWGKMEHEQLSLFINWLYDKDLEPSKLYVDQLYDSKFLPEGMTE